LFYFLDFEHYRQTGKSVTELKYYAWEKGPVAVELFNSLENPDKIEGLSDFISTYKEEFGDEGKFKIVIKPKKEFNSKLFSKREIKILAHTVEIFEESSGKAMTDASHFYDLPWIKTIKEKGMKELIEYDLIIDEKDNSISKERLSEIKLLEKEATAFLHSL
jgi:uncharacterized phage-associated protein